MTLKLPCLVVHRGKIYQLNETTRRGLILQLAVDEKKMLDSPRGECSILRPSTRVTLRAEGTARRRARGRR